MTKQTIKRVDKPWGYELIFAHTAHYAGKILSIREGEELSLQYHQEKEESIYVVKGKLQLTFGDETLMLEPGQAKHIPPKIHHRMKALQDCEIFEVSTPQLEDVVRLQDRYGRI